MGSEKNVEGTVTIPNLSDENDADDLDISVGTSTLGPEADVLREMMRTTGAKKIREQLGKYIKSLKEGMILVILQFFRPTILQYSCL